MKINMRKLLLLFAILPIINGCTDLDVPVKSQFTDKNFPVTQADMEAVCGPAYTAFKAPYGRNYFMMTTASTDEGVMVTNDNNWYDNGVYGQLGLHTWTSSNGILNDTFNDLFTAISQCNQILAILGAAPDTEYRTRAMAEVKTMKALYYFWAMDCYGALPIVREFGKPTPVRSSRKEVAEFIESELKENMEALTTTVDKTTYSKPTKYMAQALLAKLYLNWAVYTAADVANYLPTDANPHINDVVAICDEIIKSGVYNLNDGWLSKFKPDNGPQIKDFIFAFAYNWSLDDGLVHSRFWGHKFFEKTFNMKKKPSGPMRANPEFVDKFNLPGDVRNNIWRGGKQYYENAPTTPYIVNLSKGTIDKFYAGADKEAKIDWHFELTKELIVRGATESDTRENIRQLNLGNDEIGLAMGYRNVKFYPTSESTAYSQSNDMPIFRYADVLLMKAEAILRGATATNGQTAASLVTEIRICANAPAVTTITLDELIDERGRELADEYWRRNDLIRFGKFENDWGLKRAGLNTSNTEKYRRIYPIPTQAMQLNTHWTQNNGYTTAE